MFPFRWNGILVNRCVRLCEDGGKCPEKKLWEKHCATQLGKDRTAEEWGECSDQLSGETPLCEKGLIRDMQI